MSSASSLGTLELQLTANQTALQNQLNQTRRYATKVAKDIENQINRAFKGKNVKLKGLDDTANQASKAGDKAGKSFIGRFKDALSPLKSIVSNIFSGVFIGAGIGAFNGITGAIGSAINAAKNFAGSIFTVTKDFQGFEASLKTFFKGNQQEIDKFVAKLENFAATTPYELKDLQQASIQNLATGAKPDQLIRDLQTLGDVAAGANASIKDLMEVYAKSRTEGRLTNIDIDQFTGRGVQLRAELAKMLGATQKEIRQLASDGKLEFRHLEEAMRRMSAEGGTYFKAMDNKAKTLEGRLSNVADTFYQFQKNIGQAIEPIMNYVVQMFGDIVAGLSNSKGVLSEVKKESEKLVEYFKVNPQLIEALNKAIQDLVSGTFRFLLNGIKNLAEYLEKNPDFIQDATNKFNSLLDTVYGVVIKVSEIASWLNGAIAWGIELFNQEAERAKPKFKVIQEFCAAIAELLKKHGDLFGDLMSIGLKLIDVVFKVIVKILTKTVKIITRIISRVRQLYNNIKNFGRQLKDIDNVAKKIGKSIFNWGDGIKDADGKAKKFTKSLSEQKPSTQNNDKTVEANQTPQSTINQPNMKT